MTADWVDGFYTAVATYLIKSDTVPSGGDMFRYELRSRAIHFLEECGIASVSAVDQDVDKESVFDTFDSDASRSVSYISAKVTCKCGMYKDEEFKTEATLTDIMYGVLSEA